MKGLLTFVLSAVYFYSLGQKHEMFLKNCRINKIEDFSKYRDEFGIKKLVKSKLVYNRLFYYNDSKCNFKYEVDSIITKASYIVTFKDGSNTQIDVLQFTSENYAKVVSDQLKPLVNSVRNIKTKEENKQFCINYYLSRIYNYKLIGPKMYLFGYDAHNVTSETITIEKLKYLDSICDAIK